MALITFTNGLTSSPGNSEEVILNIVELEAAVLAADPTETYLADSTNWKIVAAVFKSELQNIFVKFEESSVGQFVSSPLVALDTFKMVSVIINDFDGGKFIIPISPAEQDSLYSMVVS